ncbi:MAG: hypothetical protein KGH89_05745 [Thaumarchaeota archaeon]|nr:hypothetical protein [Nitrososphaerota archaeon]MDE1867662.1 hypothetical protein [Nitrososphaerota archaeon]
MHPSIEITAFTVNKLKNFHDDFIKYDIDVSVDEIENNEFGIKLKYKFTLLSNPTNTKLSVEGIASLCGDDIEISKHLEPDQKNIPLIVNTIYQEIFPLIYVVSKSVQIPCPAYKLSQISSAPQVETKQEEASKIPEPVEETVTTDIENDIIAEQMAGIQPLPKEIISEASVNSI